MEKYLIKRKRTEETEPKKNNTEQPSNKKIKLTDEQRAQIAKNKEEAKARLAKSQKQKAQKTPNLTDKNISSKVEEKDANTDSTTSKYAKLEDYLEGNWRKMLEDEFTKPYWKSLKQKLIEEDKKGIQIYPPIDLIFNAFKQCPFDNVKVVLIGQDPYHGARQAMGLSFSVPKGINVPPSLKNIYKEMKDDLKTFQIPNHGNLEKWAKEGVLLLNATLTVRKGQPASHKGFGWQTFTDKVIKILNEKKEGLVFLLWGRHAQLKGKIVNRKKHLVLETAHPSPYSASKFFGCKHFSKTNEYLTKNGNGPIDWNL